MTLSDKKYTNFFVRKKSPLIFFCTVKAVLVQKMDFRVFDFAYPLNDIKWSGPRVHYSINIAKMSHHIFIPLLLCMTLYL